MLIIQNRKQMYLLTVVATTFMVYSSYVEVIMYREHLYALCRTSQNLGTENWQVYLSYDLVLTV